MSIMSKMNKELLQKKPLLGVIGGMGTGATAAFYEKLHSLQNVTKEQDYQDVLLYSIPSTPDRTAFITGQSVDNPLEHLINAAQTLEEAGATCIAIPCVTSHYFYLDLVKEVSIPILNMLDETAYFVSKKGIKKVNLLATDGTVKSRIFLFAFEKYGIEVSVPSEENQRKLMAMIYEIKCGAAISPEILNNLNSISLDSLKNGTEADILGCTELCIVANESNPKLINTLDVLAEAALRQVRNERL